MNSHTVPVIRCADCAQAWLVPGLRPGESHACKGCGRPLIASIASPPAVAPAATRQKATRTALMEGGVSSETLPG